jgi:hypothetical protein
VPSEGRDNSFLVFLSEIVVSSGNGEPDGGYIWCGLLRGVALVRRSII